MEPPKSKPGAPTTSPAAGSTTTTIGSAAATPTPAPPPFIAPKLGSEKVETRFLIPFFESRWSELWANVGPGVKDEFDLPIIEQYLESGIKGRLGAAKATGKSIANNKETVGTKTYEVTIVTLPFINGDFKVKVTWNGDTIIGLILDCAPLSDFGWLTEIRTEHYAERSVYFWQSMFKQDWDTCVRLFAPVNKKEEDQIRLNFKQEEKRTTLVLKKHGPLLSIDQSKPVQYKTIPEKVPTRIESGDRVFSLYFDLKFEKEVTPTSVQWRVENFTGSIRKYTIMSKTKFF